MFSSRPKLTKHHFQPHRGFVKSLYSHNQDMSIKAPHAPASQSASVPPPINDMASTQPFRFLDLPAEMRDEVYRICLSRGKVFLGRQRAYDLRFEGCRDQLPIMWNVLAINREMREEAAKVLFLENMMVLGGQVEQKLLHTEDFRVGDGSQTTERSEKDLSLATLARKSMISLSLTFNTGNYSLDPVLGAADARQELASNPYFNPQSQDEWISDCHRMTSPLGWAALLNEARDCPLQNFQLDVSHCYDSEGCCRLVDTLSQAIAAWLVVMPASLRTIEFLGTKSQAERQNIKRDLNNSLFGRFDPGQLGLAAMYGRPIFGTVEELQRWDKEGEEIRNRTPLRLRFKKFQASNDSRVRGLDAVDLEELEDDEVLLTPPTLS